MDFKRRTPIVSTPRLTSFKYRWADSHVVVVSYCFSIATKNKGTTPWHGRGFFIIGVVDLESGMGIALVFYGDLYFFNNNYCYHHNQVNIKKRLAYQHMPSRAKLSYFIRPCFVFLQPLRFGLKSWPNFCTYLCWCWKRNCHFGQQC